MRGYIVDDGTILYSLDRNKPIFYDCETCISPSAKAGDYDTLALITIRQGTTRLVIYPNTVGYKSPNQIDPFIVAMTLSEFKIVCGQNIQYDLRHLVRFGYTTDKLERLIDTLYGFRIRHPEWREQFNLKNNDDLEEDNDESAYKLSDIVKRVYAKLNLTNPYEGMVKSEMQKSFTYYTPPTPLQIEYALADVDVLPNLCQYLGATFQTGAYMNLENAVKATFKMKGMPVDTAEVDRVFAKTQEALLPVEEGVVYDMIDETYDTDNPRAIFSISSTAKKKQVLGLEFSADSNSLDTIRLREGGMSGLVYKPHKLASLMKGKIQAKLKTKSYKAVKLSEQIAKFEAKNRGLLVKKEFVIPPIDLFLLTHYGITYYELAKKANFRYTTRSLNSVLPTPVEYRIEPNYTHTDYKAKLAQVLAEQQELATQYRFKKRVTKFLKDGRIASNYTSTVAVTTRLQAKKENILQYPRAVKTIFGCPVSGSRVLVSADYGQIELRILMLLMGTKDSSMYQDFVAGIDIHTKTTNMILTILPVSLLNLLKSRGIDPRQLGKKANFGLLYGAGEGVLQGQILKDLGVWIELPILSELVKAWRGLYPDIVAWQKENQSKTTTYSLAGRPFYYHKEANNYSDRNNHQNQGSASEVEHRAFVLITERLSSLSNAYLVHYQYDSYTIECNKEDSVEVADIMAHSMQEAWREMAVLTVCDDLPMPVEVSCGYNWGRIENPKYNIFTKEY